jgi:hypothetical protein
MARSRQIRGIPQTLQGKMDQHSQDGKGMGQEDGRFNTEDHMMTIERIRKLRRGLQNDIAKLIAPFITELDNAGVEFEECVIKRDFGREVFCREQGIREPQFTITTSIKIPEE